MSIGSLVVGLADTGSSVGFSVEVVGLGEGSKVGSVVKGVFVGELVDIDVGSGVGVIVDKGGEGFEVGDAV